MTSEDKVDAAPIETEVDAAPKTYTTVVFIENGPKCLEHVMHKPVTISIEGEAYIINRSLTYCYYNVTLTEIISLQKIRAETLLKALRQHGGTEQCRVIPVRISFDRFYSFDMDFVDIDHWVNIVYGHEIGHKIRNKMGRHYYYDNFICSKCSEEVRFSDRSHCAICKDCRPCRDEIFELRACCDSKPCRDEIVDFWSKEGLPLFHTMVCH